MLGHLGIVANSQGDYVAAAAYHGQTLVISRELRDRYGEATNIANLGLAAWFKGDFALAKSNYEQSLLIAQEIGTRWGEAIISGNLGHLAQDQAEYGEAKHWYENGIAMARQIIARDQEGISLNGLGWVALAEQHPKLAASYFQQAQTIRQEIHQPQLLVEDWVGLAQAHLAMGNEQVAGKLIKQILAYLKENPRLRESEHPIRAFRFTWEVLLALDMKTEADELLMLGIQAMQKYLRKISNDQAAQEMYLRQPHHQVLWQVWTEKSHLSST